MSIAQNFLKDSTEKQLNFKHNDTCSELFMKELENFIILEKNLELIEKIGEGMNERFNIHFIISF